MDHDRLLTFAEFARMTMGTNQQEDGEKVEDVNNAEDEEKGDGEAVAFPHVVEEESDAQCHLG